MREIKFRAWDSHNNIMINPFCELKDNRFWGEDCTNTGYAPSNIMQYTGLKDKNGKEIYEGDILKLSQGSKAAKENVFEVIYDFGAFQMKMYPPAENPCAFITYGVQCTKYLFGIQDEKTVQSYLEVIGNIYENPNLLK